MRISALHTRLRAASDGAPDASAPAAPAAFGVSVGAALRTAAIARAAGEAIADRGSRIADSQEPAPAPAPAEVNAEPAPAPAAEPETEPDPQSAIGNPQSTDPMAVLLAKLEALEARLDGKAPAPAEPVADANPPSAIDNPQSEPAPAPSSLTYKTTAELDRAEADAESALKWLRANRDGVEYQADGKTVRLNADQVDDEIDRLRDELYRKLPRARTELAAWRESERAARLAHPTHFDARHADSKAIAALFSEFPSLNGNHRLAADILRGRRALAKSSAPAAPAAAPARAPAPPSAPVAEPVRAGVRTEPSIDRDRMARDGIGFGHLLRKR